MRKFVCIAGLLIIVNHCSFGQSGQQATSVTDFPNKFFARINRKAAGLDEALTRQTERYLKKLAKQEQKIHDRLYKLDSNAAKNLFAGTQNKYASLESSSKNSASTHDAPLAGEYVPYADSLKSSLAFAQKNPQAINASPKQQQEINAALSGFNQLQGKFQNADQVKEYFRQRKEAALQSNLETAHEQLDQYKDKLSALGGGSADMDMPNFRPNDQN